MSRPLNPQGLNEPTEIKKFVRNLVSSGVSPTYAIWLGNKLPKYLWSSLSKDLRPRGLKWQSFLRCISQFEDDVIKWVNGDVSWEALINEIMEGCRLGSVRGERVGLTRWFGKTV